jgi:YHS domain-containing protein
MSSHIVYDPVCGMRVNADGFNINTDFKGHKVYFCAESCRDKFLADPHRFLKPKNWWRRYLDRLARSNAKLFGGKGPTCCG